MLTKYQHFEKIFCYYWRGFQPISPSKAYYLSCICKHDNCSKKDGARHCFLPQICTMFKKLQQKWKVNGTDLALILCTFAVTGTLTAWISRQITGWLQVDKYSFGWWALKIGVLLLGYQILILIIGFCFGQFRFFWNYEKKILRRLGFFKSHPQESATQTAPARLAIFASGTGNNALKIIEHFAGHSAVKVALVVCNNPAAGVLEIAKKHQIPVLLIEKGRFVADGYVKELMDRPIDFIALAGFLWQLPPALVAAFPNRIVNIHPALLPKFGGKGMYGKYVHQAVIDAKELKSGITIHYVDEQYDHGSPILQVTCPITPEDDASSLAQKIHLLEHAHYAKTLEKLIVNS